MSLCSDSTCYYRVFGPSLDFKVISCEEKKLCQFCCILTVFRPIRRGCAPPPIRIDWGWALGAVNPSTLDHDWIEN